MDSVELTDELIIELINQMANGLSLKSQLKLIGVEPFKFFDALNDRPDLEALYTRAQVARAELEVENIIDIADTEDDAQRARNRIDTRRWYAAKMRPQKYGDRIDLNINQTVDIGSALIEAKSRVLPQRDLNLIESPQRAESNEIIIDSTSDQQSDGAPQTHQDLKKSSDSIFD